MADVPKSGIAPHDPCVACFAGDTDTALIVRGEAEFLIAFLNKMFGLTMDVAQGTVLNFAEDLGCEPGTVPSGQRDWPLRVCERCAGAAGMKVGKINAGELPGYVQPAGMGEA